MSVRHFVAVTRALSSCGPKTTRALARETGIDYDTVRKILLGMRECGFAETRGVSSAARGIKPVLWTLRKDV